MYRGDLRSVVIVMAVVGAVWALIWTVGSFEDIHTDKTFGTPKLGTLDIVLGAIFAATAAIEIFGIGAATSRRVSLMQSFTLLSIIGCVLVIGSQILLFVLHFVFKTALINECEQLSQNATVVERIGVWGPIVTDKLEPDQIAQACTDLWSHDSITSFVWIVVVALYALFSTVLAFAYVHQLRDPTSVVNASRAPSNQARAAAYAPSNFGPGYGQQHYQPPYANAAVPNLSYGAGPYAPPPGPPPGAYSNANLPGYDADAAKGPGYGTDKGDDPFADFESRSHARRGSDETLTESGYRAQGSKFDV